MTDRTSLLREAATLLRRGWHAEGCGCMDCHHADVLSRRIEREITCTDWLGNVKMVRRQADALGGSGLSAEASSLLVQIDALFARLEQAGDGR